MTKDRKKKLKHMGVLLIIATTIFVFSSQSAEMSHRISDKFLQNILHINTLNYSDASLRPIWFGLSIRKYAHIFLYFLLGASCFWIVSDCFEEFKEKHKKLDTKFAVWIKAGISFVVCLLFAGFDEMHQSLSTGRGVSLTDVFIDAIGFTFSVLLITLFLYNRKIFECFFVVLLICILGVWGIRHIRQSLLEKSCKDMQIKQVQNDDIYTLGAPTSNKIQYSTEHTKNVNKAIKLSTNSKKRCSVTLINLDIDVMENDILGFWFWTSRDTIRQYGEEENGTQLTISINDSVEVNISDCYKSHAGFNIAKLKKGAFVGTIKKLKFTLIPNTNSYREFYIDSVQINYKEPTYVIFNFDLSGEDFYETGYPLFRKYSITATFSYFFEEDEQKNNVKTAKVYEEMLKEGFDYGVFSSIKSLTLKEKPLGFYEDYEKWLNISRKMMSVGNLFGIQSPSTCMSWQNKVGETYDKAMVQTGFMINRYSTSNNMLDYFDEEYREFPSYGCASARYADDSQVKAFKSRLDEAIEYGYSIAYGSGDIIDSNNEIPQGCVGTEALEAMIQYAVERQNKGLCKVVTFAEYMRLEHSDIYAEWKN